MTARAVGDARVTEVWVEGPPVGDPPWGPAP
jgi:hypothetical protein